MTTFHCFFIVFFSENSSFRIFQNTFSGSGPGKFFVYDISMVSASSAPDFDQNPRCCFFELSSQGYYLWVQPVSAPLTAGHGSAEVRERGDWDFQLHPRSLTNLAICREKITYAKKLIFQHFSSFFR